MHREHGRERPDPYAWLRDREDPATRAYLEAENAHTRAVLAPTEGRQRRLYDEMLGRIKQTDHSVPFAWGPFLYYSRTEEGKSYRVLCRRPREAGEPGPQPDDAEQILVDQNARAEGRAFYSLGDYEPDPAHARLATLTDTVGDERYVLEVTCLRTGEPLALRIEGVGRDVAWSADGRFLFYVRLDPSMRPYQVMRHALGTSPEHDVLVHHETDEAFYVGLGVSRSRRFVVMGLHSQVTSEVRLLPADRPEDDFWVVAPRRRGIEYSVAHHGERLLVVTNEDAQNFRVMEASLARPQREHWVERIPHRPEVKIDAVHAFAGHLVVARRERGLPVLGVEDLGSGQRHDIELPEPVYDVWLGTNLEWEAQTLRLGYTSLVTPHSVYDYEIDARVLRLRKQTEVRDYDASRFCCDRVEADAPDGTKIPVSLVHRADLDRRRPQPTVLVGYGAYGYPNDPGFSSSRVSLLERGMIYAVAHVRGGGELGRPWYEAGKLQHKPNTFADFVACAQMLVDEGYTEPAKLAIRGASAGGLLIGAVLNERPELFGAAVADVPFVDMLSTMLDDRLPLTVVEYDEWGDPNDRSSYEVMASYSPYDNVRAQPYPPLLVLAGLSDPRVGYWEPAKWVARLRATATGEAPLLLHTNMDAGHGGASGRYDALRETARWYAFVLEQLGVAEEDGARP